MSYPFHLLEEELHLFFTDKALLKQALTHSSYAKQKKSKFVSDNERLEFLGDSVIKLIVSDYLYKKFPTFDEGDLTKLRAKLVSDHSLGHIAQSLNLGPYMIMSHGEANTGGESKVSNLANVFEALLGAYFLDKGLGPVSAYFIPIFEAHYDEILQEEDTQDHKTSLQEWTQKHRIPLPKYTVLKEEGPDHDKTFHIEVQVIIHTQTKNFRGKGINKKMAQQSAAKAALAEIHTQRSPQ